MDIVPMGQMKPFIAMRISIDVCIYNTYVCGGEGGARVYVDRGDYNFKLYFKLI